MNALKRTRIAEGNKIMPITSNITILYPDQENEPKESRKGLRLEDLVKALEEDSEWVGDNNYEVPITLYDHLLMAAEAIRLLSELAENGESSMQTSAAMGKKLDELSVSVTSLKYDVRSSNQRLAETSSALKHCMSALTLACEWFDRLGICVRKEFGVICPYEQTGKPKNCAKCMREYCLEVSDIIPTKEESDEWDECK